MGSMNAHERFACHLKGRQHFTQGSIHERPPCFCVMTPACLPYPCLQTAFLAWATCSPCLLSGSQAAGLHTQAVQGCWLTQSALLQCFSILLLSSPPPPPPPSPSPLSGRSCIGRSTRFHVSCSLDKKTACRHTLKVYRPTFESHPAQRPAETFSPHPCCKLER